MPSSDYKSPAWRDYDDAADFSRVVWWSHREVVLVRPSLSWFGQRSAMVPLADYAYGDDASDDDT